MDEPGAGEPGTQAQSPQQQQQANDINNQVKQFAGKPPKSAPKSNS
jgi:hypothetical protein